MSFVVLIALVGLMICLYGLWVEKQLERDAGYKPVCDISDRASCTKVIKSPYARLLGFSNIYAGIIFYVVTGICAYIGLIHIVLLLAVCSCIASLFLAYILYTRIKTVCVICTAIYAVNALLLVASCYYYFI